MSSKWKYAYASCAGRYHLDNGLPCQDFCDCRNLTAGDGESIFVAVASDGAGSARFAETGSKLACFLIGDEIKEFFEKGGSISNLTRDIAEKMVYNLQYEISLHASLYGFTNRDFASTLIVSVIGESGSVFFQIGDGAIVISEPGMPGEYNWVFWPQKGEYANMTNFVTERDSACSVMEYKSIEGRIDDVAVFTDGIQALALHYQSRTAHKPFFRPIFAYLKSLQDTCSNSVLNSLSSFMNSDNINKRTDDDKTLIIASREN